MHKGYMVASEVDEVCFLQTREDRRFGEIAIERGYLTEDQVRELLKTQIPDFILFGQCLVDDGAISYEELQTLVLDYEAENEMYDIDLNIESKEKITQLIERFFWWQRFRSRNTASCIWNSCSIIWCVLSGMTSLLSHRFLVMSSRSTTAYPSVSTAR